MEAALLILVLAAGDPQSLTAAQTVAGALRELRADARVVIAPEAAKLLAERGVGDNDLVTRTDKPLTATAANPKLILLRVERRDAASDKIVVVDLWAGGRWEGSTAIAGKTGDPVPAAVDNARRLLGGAVAALDPAVAAERRDRLLIAPFVERGDWAGLVAIVEQQEKPSPRLRYQAIMALLRLGDRDGARAALAKLTAAAPGHALVREATAAVEADPAGSDTLRDHAPADDGGNVLR